MQLYDLSEEEKRKQNRKPYHSQGRALDRRQGNAKSKGTSGRKKKAQKELQMIGASTPVQKHRKIRADVVTKLDIIAEDVYEEERRERRERQRRIRQRRIAEEQEALRSRERRNVRAVDEYDDEDFEEEYHRRKRRKREKSSFVSNFILFTSIIIMAVLIVILGKRIWNLDETQEAVSKVEGIFSTQKRVAKPDIVEDYLEVNEFSRPGEALGKVRNIFVHYTANPGTTAKQNRNYFEGLAESGETSASAHFVIGYDGEIIQCIPLQEIGYAVKEYNYNSVSIECCYQDEDGHFTDATYQSLLQLTTWLMGEYRLSADDVLRHFDASGKLCPKYYVENESMWLNFKAELENYIAANGR